MNNMLRIFILLISFIFLHWSIVSAVEKPEVFIPAKNNEDIQNQDYFVSGNFSNWLILYSYTVFIIWDIKNASLETIVPSNAFEVNKNYYLSKYSYGLKYDNKYIYVTDKSQVSKDGKLIAKIITHHDRKITSLIRASDNKEVARFYVFKDGEWIILTPEGYYNASPNAEKYLNVKIGNKVYNIENFKKIFNRPNIVKAALEEKSISSLMLPTLEFPDIQKNTKYSILITGVLNDSAADKAGIKEGDIIYSINDKIFYESNNKDVEKEFVEYLKILPVGFCKITLIREGRKITTTANITELSSTSRLDIFFEIIENNAQIYFDKALAQLQNISSREDLKAVARLFEIAKAISPEWADLYYNLGMIYEELTYYDKAIENFSKYLDLVKDRNSVESKNIISKIKENKKNLEKLEYMKERMVDGELIIEKGRPPHLVPPIFKRDKSNQIVMINPYWDYVRRLKKAGYTGRSGVPSWIPYDYINNVSSFPVKFDGRYFEVRYFTIERYFTKQGSLFYVILYLMKGELYLDSFRLKTINLFRSTGKRFNSFEEAKNNAYEIISSHKLDFDEVKDVRVREVMLEIDEEYRIWEDPRVYYKIK